MKRILAFCLAAVLMIVLLAACGSSLDIAGNEQQQAEASGLTLHKIGVGTYNIQDAQVMMFKDYLDNYIKECFPDVTFLYSDSITNADDMMSFLQACADAGCEGFMAFTSYDLQKEVDFCAANEMYYIRPAGTTADADFESVAGNPWYVGEIGPGAEIEYDSGADMTAALAHAGDGQNFLVMTGGAFMGNEMHRLRTMGILETLEQVYGVSLGDLDALAHVTERTDVQAGGMTVTLCPGYLELPVFGDPAAEAIRSGRYSTVLSTIPVTALMDALQAVEVRCGVIDCFSEDNYFGFKKDKIAYVAGKYQSEIGPAFAALYNAITGNAEMLRVDGRGFRLQQGFWTAADNAEFDSMYALACGAAVNAYNYDDLYSVVRSLSPDADFDAFKTLVESYSYEDCLARRAA